jgi:ABC-type dipeptide/oligopeptide/nickel transport system ATPase component
MSTSPLLDVDNLSIHFATPDGPVHAVNGMSFAMQRGETLAIVGEQGAGKSVTALALLGRVAGLPGASVQGMIALHGEAALLSHDPVTRDHTQPDAGSTALAARPQPPDLLIVDEPTAGLALPAQTHGLEQAERLRRDHGTALLLLTHDLGLVAGMADRVLVLYAGRVVEEGSASAIFENPRMPYTIELLRSLSPSSTLVASSRERRARQQCPFSGRCPYVQAACLRQVPPLRSVNGHDNGTAAATSPTTTMPHRAACLFDITLETPVPLTRQERERIPAPLEA